MSKFPYWFNGDFPAIAMLAYPVFFHIFFRNPGRHLKGSFGLNILGGASARRLAPTRRAWAWQATNPMVMDGDGWMMGFQWWFVSGKKIPSKKNINHTFEGWWLAPRFGITFDKAWNSLVVMIPGPWCCEFDVCHLELQGPQIFFSNVKYQTNILFTSTCVSLYLYIIYTYNAIY